MKLRYLGIFRTTPGEDALELCREYYVEDLGYFYKGPARQMCSFGAGTAAERTKPHVLNVALDGEESNPRYIYAYGREGGICATMITSDDKYGGDETRLAISLLRKISDEFLTKYSASAIKQATTANSLPFPELAAYIIKYQKPTEADAIGRIQKELDETKVVLHQTIESMLERGEKIDNLVSKSENLSQASKMFYTQAKKQNSCCIVM